MSRIGRPTAQTVSQREPPATPTGSVKVALAAAKKEFDKAVDGDWKPEALPRVKRLALPKGALAEFDRMTRRSQESDMYDPPVAHRFIVERRGFFAVSQFTHDSFGVSLFDAAGKKVASGTGWGSTSNVDWNK
jgi:hypothetical protein